MARSSKSPDNAIIVSTYQELDKFVRGFSDGHLNLLVLIGAPGLQKSQNVRQALGKSACWIEGNATPFRIYCKLWAYRDRLVILDDVDSLYANHNGVRLLKCLCQTEPQKRVAWDSDAATLDREGIPRQFTTASRLAIIANQWKTLNDNVAAVEDRGHIVLFRPTALEVHLRTAEWFWDQEIFDFIGEQLSLIVNPSMRTYIQAWELKQSRMDWKGMLLNRWLSGPPALVAQLKADNSYPSEEHRVQAFIAKGGGCRASYFNHAKTLQGAINPPRVTLTNSGAYER